MQGKQSDQEMLGTPELFRVIHLRNLVRQGLHDPPDSRKVVR